jgi:hypothetical protein
MAFIVGQYLVSYYQGSREQVEQAIGRNYRGIAAVGTTSPARRSGATRRNTSSTTTTQGRDKYAKEWGDTYGKLEKQLARMQANADRIFTKDDLAQFAVWSDDLLVYGIEMRRIIDDLASGGTQAVAGSNPTREVNGRIKVGKDRFANLLKGAVKMEGRKATEAIAASQQIKENFDQLGVMLLAVVGAGVALVAFTLPRATPRPSNRLSMRPTA